MKQRFIRVGDEISDETTLVIRGGLLDAMLLRADALRNHEIYGTYGISVLALRDVAFDELASGQPLVRFASLGGRAAFARPAPRAYRAQSPPFRRRLRRSRGGSRGLAFVRAFGGREPLP